MSKIKQNPRNQSWGLRVIKGMFIGSGFIVPGVSGGALAAIFGLYEPLIRFLSNLSKNFVKNLRFFLPVGLGALLGIAILSWGVSFLLGSYETMTKWFFVGAIVGTLPSLWVEAGKEGREGKDYWILIGSLVLGLGLLAYGNSSFGGQVPANFFTWFFCGVLIALGALIPGLSPSNFIVYMGLYQAMADGFKTFDLAVMVPIGLGGLVTIVTLSKAIEYIFDHFYAEFFHFIYGIVIASTLMIIPRDYSGLGLLGYTACLVMLFLGILLSRWMVSLEGQSSENQTLA